LKTFGRKGRLMGSVMFITVLLLAVMIYFMLLSQYLYPILNFIIELYTKQSEPIDLKMDFSKFSYSYTCVIVLIILFLITSRKEMGILLKINTLGVFFTILVLISTLVIGIYGLITCKYEIVVSYDNSVDRPKPVEEGSSVIILFGSCYYRLLGILTGGFYCHNISLPIYRDNKHPEHNVRDMFYGFTVVALNYIICGVVGSIGFSNTNLFGPDVRV